MKQFTDIFKVAAVAMTACIMASCSSREQESYGDGAAIASPAVKVTGATYNSISYSWEPVSGAVEYGYFCYDTDGILMEGDITKLTSVTISDLTFNTNYVMKVFAYAAVNHEQASSPAGEITSMTGFFDVIDTTGTYTSAITGKTWTTARLTETRTEERQWGSFVLVSWYGKTGYNLEFTVHGDSLITITNGTKDESTGYQLVKAGPDNASTNSYVRKGALIDESRSRFDFRNNILRLYVIATTGTKEGEDTFEWE